MVEAPVRRVWTPRHQRELHPTCALCSHSLWQHVIEGVRHNRPTYEHPCPGSLEDVDPG